MNVESDRPRPRPGVRFPRHDLAVDAAAGRLVGGTQLPYKLLDLAAPFRLASLLFCTLWSRVMMAWRLSWMLGAQMGMKLEHEWPEVVMCHAAVRQSVT